jgi:imidazolonepropionase-like amidohydrolase
VITPARPLVLEGVRVWDGVTDRTTGPVHLRIEGRRIVGFGRERRLLQGADVWRAPEGAVAMPGLIDVHVHLTLDPAVTSVADQLALPEDTVRAGSEARALAMARAGITTARDLGGASWLEVALRDRIDAGELPGPRLLCAGQPLTSPGGHCHFWGGEVRGAAFAPVITRQVQHDVDWIKVMATGGINTKGTSIRDAQFDVDQLRRIREIAERQGRPVAAHCHGTAGIRNAAEAGLASIEHCSFAGERGYGDGFDAGLPAAIRTAGCWVSPTVNAGWQRFLADEEKARRFFDAMQRAFAALRDAGVPLIASTDAGIPNVRHADLAHALPVFARFAGFSNVEVLRSATSDAARVLGLRSETGSLRPGLAADVLVVPGDPLEDLAHLQTPLFVLARGRPLL